MNVILLKNVDNLGQTGDTVKVKDGYGRNYLVPRGFAVIADERNSRRMAHQKRQAEAAAAKELGAAKELADKIDQTAVSIKREAGEEDVQKLREDLEREEAREGHLHGQDVPDVLAEADAEAEAEKEGETEKDGEETIDILIPEVVEPVEAIGDKSEAKESEVPA